MMKNINYLYMAVGAILLFACNPEETGGPTGDPLTLTGPTEKVVLLESNKTATAVTFTWNKGIDRAPTDTLTYIFRMDIANQDFATATPRDTVTDFTKSFTVGELNDLIIKQWNVHPGEEIVLEARVVANVRGEKFVYPEIAITSFTVVTYQPAPLEVILTMKTLPDQIYYPVGGQLDLTGAVITVTSDEGETDVPVAAYMVSGFESVAVGVQTLTVAYGGKTTTFEVEILPALADRIAAVAGTAATITLYYDEASAPITLGGSTELTLVGDRKERAVSMSGGNGSLFSLNDNAKLTLGDKVTLKGLGLDVNSNSSLVNISGSSTLTLLDGSKLCDNWKDSNYGSVVSMFGASPTAANFIMSGGSITGNKVKGYGAIYMENGTFTMTGGTISNNIAADASVVRGGAMYIAAGGIFNMSGGTITGNNNGLGGGVHNNGTFNLSGGTITGNTSNLSVPDVYVRKGAIVTAIGGAPVTNIALEVDAKLTQNAAFSGTVSIDLAGTAADWTGKTILTKGGNYQGAFGNFTLGNFVNTGTGAKTAISGYHIDADGKFTN